MMTNDTEEYKQLYTEIGRNSQVSQHVFVANVAVTAALIGYGLQASSGPIFLAPFAIIIPSLFFLASQLESTTRIAAYIFVFLEPASPNLNWETRWFSMRKQGLLPSPRKYTFSLSSLYGMVSAVCLALAFFHWQQQLIKWFYVAAVPIAILLILGIATLVRAFSLSLCEAYVSAWRKLMSQSAN